MSLLVFNAGSGSLKFAAFEPTPGGRRCAVRGSLAPLDERGVMHLRHDGGEYHTQIGYAGPAQSVRYLIERITPLLPGGRPPRAVAHRVVYGSGDSAGVARVDAALLDRLRRSSMLAPLHEQLEIDIIEAAAAALGWQIPVFAAFDGSFFDKLPPVAANYAVAEPLRRRLGLRRKGFHGFAHASMLDGYGAMRGTREGQRVISFQLGGGCSAAATVDGRPVDTSMGFTPLEGLVMATRCGDLDAGAVFQALRSGIEPQRLQRILEAESGLLGVSGLSGDMNVVLDAAHQGHAAAALARDLYCTRARKYLGAYLATLGGADAVLFGGGVGEHLPQIRARVCRDFEYLGLRLDEAANRANAARISPDGALPVHVAPADEEGVIATAVAACLNHP